MLRVLVVDDHATVREGLIRILTTTQPGWQVRDAASGEAALALVESQPFDVGIVDVSMPVMNGLDCMLRLRRMPGGTGPRVLFCSVETAPAMIRQALDAGASEFIMKPFDGEILASKLALAGLR